MSSPSGTSDAANALGVNGIGLQGVGGFVQCCERERLEEAIELIRSIVAEFTEDFPAVLEEHDRALREQAEGKKELRRIAPEWGHRIDILMNSGDS